VRAGSDSIVIAAEVKGMVLRLFNYHDLYLIYAKICRIDTFVFYSDERMWQTA